MAAVPKHGLLIWRLGLWLAAGGWALPASASPALAQTIAIHAGKVVDPATGRVEGPRWIVVDGGKITGVLDGTTPPAGATVLDLSNRVVLPGLMDVHTHLTAAYEPGATNLRDYTTAVSTAERALEGVANAWQMLAAGFTTVRDLGNAGNYADAALATFFGSNGRARKAVYGAAVLDSITLFGHPLVGPTIVFSGKIITPLGGQFTLSPEFPEVGKQDYLYADSHDQIRQAIRQNVLYGATWIKIAVDDHPYRYSLDDLRFIVAEAERAGAKVAAHCVTEAGARDAIVAGVASVEHGYEMSDGTLALAKEKGVFLVGTDPAGYWMRRSGRSAFDSLTIDRLRRAYRIGVPMAFGTDALRAPTGSTRGEIALSVIESWTAAGIPAPDILKAMTTTAARLLGMEKERGRVAAGYAADLIATMDNPLDDITALRKVVFIMKDGRVVKSDR